MYKSISVVDEDRELKQPFMDTLANSYFKKLDIFILSKFRTYNEEGRNGGTLDVITYSDAVCPIEYFHGIGFRQKASMTSLLRLNHHNLTNR